MAVETIEFIRCDMDSNHGDPNEYFPDDQQPVNDLDAPSFPEPTSNKDQDAYGPESSSMDPEERKALSKYVSRSICIGIVLGKLVIDYIGLKVA